MVYTYDNSFRQISITDFDRDNLTFALISPTEFENSYIDFGLSFSALQRFQMCSKSFRNRIETFDSFTFGTVRLINHNISDKTEADLAFYIMKNTFIIIADVNAVQKVRDYFISSIEKLKNVAVTAEKFIFTFFDNMISDDNEALENIEFELNNLEERILDMNETDGFNSQIFIYKKKLLYLRNYYEQLIDLGNVLYENTNSIFKEKELNCFLAFTSRVERYRDNVNLLNENLVHIREAYQASLDSRLNNTMKIFTVVTSIFLPLTLIVGWYGMNFKYMPELEWKYGYPAVIIASIICVVICIVLFRKKKLM